MGKEVGEGGGVPLKKFVPAYKNLDSNTGYLYKQESCSLINKDKAGELVCGANLGIEGEGRCKSRGPNNPTS